MNEQQKQDLMVTAIKLSAIMAMAPVSAFVGYKTLAFLDKRGMLRKGKTDLSDAAEYNGAVRQYNAAVVKFNQAVEERGKSSLMLRELLEVVDQEAFDALFDEIMRREF